jgi:DNA polymerase-1
MRFYKTTLSSVQFQCTASQCPKHQESVNVHQLGKIRVPFSTTYKSYGCAQFRTFVYGIAPEAVSPEDFAQAPLIAVILPSPDPTGAQGAAQGFGFSIDVIFESFLAAPHVPKVLRIAIMYLTRGYSFSSVSQGELINRHVSPAAIAHCLPFLKSELQQLKPDKLLLCGYEVANTFLQGEIQIATNRRQSGLTATIDGMTYPVQVTYNPHFTSVVPPILCSIREDCTKMFYTIPSLPVGTYRILRTLDEVLEFLDGLEQHEGYCALDYETANLNRKATNALGTLQFATSEKEGVVIPYEHHQTPFDPYELRIIRKRLTKLFSQPIKMKGWIIHNAKFEQTRTKAHFGIFIRSAPIYDTQAMAYLQDETRSERKADIPKGGGIYSLKQLSRDLLGFDGYSKGALAARSEGTLIDLDLEELADYGAMDVRVTHALFFKLRELARTENYESQLMRLARLFYDPATRLIAHVEMAGFKTRLKYVRDLASRKGPFETRLEDLESEMKAMGAFKAANDQIACDKNGGAPRGVMGIPWLLDLGKPAHQKLVFFDTMRLEPVSWAEKSGQSAVDDEFFEEYADKHKEVDLFSKWTETKKLRDTFITKTLDRIDPETGDPDCRLDQRIRPDIHYSRLVTGRWAAVKPNLGQIPRADDSGISENELAVKKAVKNIFTVDPGCALIQFDYKVNEVRWAAILSQDRALAKIFNEAAALTHQARLSGDAELIAKAELYEDVHKGTASMMFGTPRELVEKKQRQASKTITFGLLFGQGAGALANTLGITSDEAEVLMTKFFAQMREVDLWIKHSHQMAQQNSFVEAPDGRRRRFWGFHLPESCLNRNQHVARNLRQCVNSLVQGIASGSAMVGGGASLLDYIEEKNKPWLIQNLVHDSCIVQVPVEDTVEALMIGEDIFVHQAMKRMEEMGVKFNLPLGVDAEVGVYWGDLSKWGGTQVDAERLAEMVRTHWASQ